MSTHPHSALFSDVDHSKDPDFFIRFMDEAQKPAGMAESKRLMRQRMALTSGAAVLEVGCGPGADLLDLTETVGPGGRIVGVDASEVMIAEGRRRVAERRLPVTVAVCDVEALAFPDASFDACRAARLLEHLPDAGRALSEMVRVTRPRGRIVVFDFDWDTLIIDHPDKETTRTVVRTYCDSIRNGWIGRQLPRLFKESGLTDVSVDAVQVFVHDAMVELFLGSHLARLQEDGVLPTDQARRWWAYLRDVAERGMLMVSFTAFVVVGTVG